MAKRDYYNVLGLSEQASAQEIKAAYRKLAVQHHPDRNPGDHAAEEQFKEAAEAYAVLSDAEKRARYDRFGHQGLAGAGGFDPSIFADFSDVVGDFFGLGDLFGNRRGPRAEAGADLRYDLALSFEEAAFGTEASLRIPRLEECPDCSGTGGKDGHPPETCNVCAGRGQVRYTQGFFTLARTCPRCGGEGRIITKPCPACHGEGRVERERKIQVKIPAGVDTGARLRIGGEGEHGRRGGGRGDLYVVMRVEPHARFEREGANVFGPVEIGYAQAVLGASVEVETLHGPIPLEIPPGTAGGTEFRLRGKGIARLGGGGRGDHVARVEVHVPEAAELSEEQVQLLHRLAELDGRPVREDRGVLEKVKDFFG